MKFVHAADLHLDSPLRGLERYEGAPVERIRGATRRAMENLVELCIDEDVAFLLLAGDVYDGDWKDYSTGLFFSTQMSRLREAGVRVFLIRGNHDAQSQIAKHLHLPDNVIELSTREPQTKRIESLGVAVHGQGFKRREVTEDLAAQYPAAEPDAFNVGLLHTALGGRVGHEPYAPCTVETLRSRGYDYWALGHVHAREVVCDDPWIVFPGNLQGRHARETGPKGASLVEVRSGRVAAVEHRALDVVRWERLAVDASGAATADDVVDLVRAALQDAVEGADGRLVAARLEVVGASRAHDALLGDAERWENTLRAQAIDVGPDAVWVEKVRLGTRPVIDLDEVLARDDAVGELLRAVRQAREGGPVLDALAAELSELARKLPREAREGEDGVRPDDPAYLREALDDVERMILPRLMSVHEDGGR
ncbi:MAG: metallophosphoesterase family protein [Myxococcota bacterium]